MHWEFTAGKPHPGIPARVQEAPHGTMRFKPLPPRPPRDLYKAVVDADDWPQITAALIQFWIKVCDVLTEYYGSAGDSSWDRLVCTVNALDGYARAQARLGDRDPESDRNVTVFVKIPWIEQASHALEKFDFDDERFVAGTRELHEQLESALTAAAASPPANSRLKELGYKKRFELTMMRGTSA